MKKIIFILVAVLISFTAFEQRGIPRTDNVSVSSTVVKRTTRQSESKYRFQQMAEFQIGYSFDSAGYLIGVAYTAGCRFSNWFFLGCGVGYNANGWDTWIPMYMQMRGYFSKKSLKPYAALSLGCAYNSYCYYLSRETDFGFHGDFSIGVEIPLNKKLNFIVGVGVSQIGVPIKLGITF